MLFHALVVLLFGAPSGGSREGRAMWGSLQVVLQGPTPAPQPTLKLDRGLAVPKAPPATREKTAGVPERRTGPAPTEAPFTFPPLLDRIVAPELKLEQAPALRVPQPTEIPFVPRPTTPERTVTPEIAEPAPVAPAPIPVAPTPPVERPPVETVAVPVPATPPVERPPVETSAVPVPSAPAVERPPVEVPAIPVPPTQSVTPPRIEPAPTPSEKALSPEVPIAPALPPAIERPPPAPVIERPPPPPAIERAAPRPPDADSLRKVEPEPPVRTPFAPSTSPFKPPAPASVAPEIREGAPSTTYDPTAPKLDLDAVRKRAGQIAREGSGQRAVLPFPMPPAPERKSKEAIALEKARKPDCRTAYQGLGLLAIAPLIANEFGEGTCRW